MPIGGGDFGVPPDVPILANPGNNTTGISVTPLFEWNEILTNCTFTLYIYNQSGTLLHQFSDITVQNYQLSTPLDYGTQYTWKIKATNSDGSTNSSVSSFTTEPLPAPEHVPYINISYNNNNAIPTFDWGSVANADHYHIKITKP